MQRFKFIDFVVIELRFFKNNNNKKKKKKKKKKKMETRTKCENQILCTSYITTQPIFGILVIFHTFFTLISLKVKSTSKLKVKMNKILIYGFQWG